MTLTDTQKMILQKMSTIKANDFETTSLARWLSLSSIAINSSLLALHRKGIVEYSAPKDKWDCRHWFICSAFRGETLVKLLDSTGAKGQRVLPLASCTEPR